MLIAARDRNTRNSGGAGRVEDENEEENLAIRSPLPKVSQQSR